MTQKKPPESKVANIVPFGLRMPPGLKEQLTIAAEKSGRSLNAEIVSRLEATTSEDGYYSDIRRKLETESTKLNDMARNFHDAVQSFSQETKRHVIIRDMLSMIGTYVLKLAGESDGDQKMKEIISRVDRDDPTLKP